MGARYATPQRSTATLKNECVESEEKGKKGKYVLSLPLIQRRTFGGDFEEVMAITLERPRSETSSRLPSSNKVKSTDTALMHSQR
jgi:hypothetical protein